MTPYVYSPDYAPDFWEHVFPVEKYRLVAQRLGAPLETPKGDELYVRAKIIRR